MRFSLVFSLLLTGIVSCQAGEVIVKHDGTLIRGEIVGFEQGTYLMQIGSFTKRIPQAEIKEIRDGSPRAATGIQPSAAPGPPPSVPAQPAAPNPMAMLSQLQQLQQLQAKNPAMQELLKIQQQKGGAPLTAADIPPSMRGQIEQMQSNPAMMGMMNRFKDPAFQKTMLENIKKMRRALNPQANPDDDPQIKMLEGLFQRLKEAEQQAPSVPTEPQSTR